MLEIVRFGCVLTTRVSGFVRCVVSTAQHKDIVFCVPLLVVWFSTNVTGSGQHLVAAMLRKSAVGGAIFKFKHGALLWCACRQLPYGISFRLTRRASCGLRPRDAHCVSRSCAYS